MKRLLLLPVFLALFLCACGAEPAPGDTGADVYQVFFPVVSGEAGLPAVGSEPRSLPEGTSPEAALMRLLLEGPASPTLSSPFPAGVALLSSSLSGGALRLDVSEQYGGLSGIDLTLADYCIALTLCQLEGVREVSVTVQGEALPFRSHQALRGSDVFLPSGADELAYVAATVYFPLSDLSGLGAEPRDVLISDPARLPYALAAAALGRPVSGHLRSLTPEGAGLLSVSASDGVCTVNLSGEFSSAPVVSAWEGKLLLYSLVNTLCTLPSVNSVRVQVEGSDIPLFGGVPADGPLLPDYSLAESG